MRIKIAIADDHQLVRRGLRKILEDFKDFQVILEASNGKELLEAIEQSELVPDIALVDYSMPVMNGVKTCEALVRSHPRIRPVALSVHDDPDTISEMINAGACSYLLKDADPEMLKRVLLSVFRDGHYYDNMIMDSMRKARTRELDGKRKDKVLAGKMEKLSDREIHFIKMCCTEKTYNEIAGEMGIAERTAESYRANIFEKLAVTSRTGVVMFAIESRLVEV